MKVLPGIQKVLMKISNLEIHNINRVMILLKIAELDDNVDRQTLQTSLGYPRRTINKGVNKLIKNGIVYERSGKKSILLCLSLKGKSLIHTILQIVDNENENGKYGHCEKCDKFELLKTHHYLPRSMFGENPFVIKLCCECHKKADALVIGKDLSKEECFKIISDFLEDST